MRINKFVAQATGLSRRAADRVIAEGRLRVNDAPAALGTEVKDTDIVSLDGQPVTLVGNNLTITLNKPVGYVCSRNGQGSKTIYDLLPAKYHALKPIGRLDKDSSGLLLLTNDGDLANRLTHPRYQKEKIYEITLDKPLAAADRQQIEQGVKIDNYTSRLGLSKIKHPSSTPVKNRELSAENRHWRVRMTQGRNRQIRRTFETLGYSVHALHRTHFGDYDLKKLATGNYQELP